MNRVLSLPHTPIFPGLLEELRHGMYQTAVTDKGTVRLQHQFGPVEMRFAMQEQQLPPGTAVQVWWKGGGFVCATLAEMAADEEKRQHLASLIARVRSQFAAARHGRTAETTGVAKAMLHDGMEASLEPALCGAPYPGYPEAPPD